MTKEYTPEEIKYRLSDLGVQIGNIAINYITELEKACDETQKLLDKQIEATYKLDKENAELKKKLKEELKTIADKDLSFVARFDALGRENAELRAKVTALENANRAMVKELDDMASNGLNILENVVTNKKQLTKAKELLEKLLLVSCNSEVLNQYPNCSKVLQARVEAEQFLNSK